jgi:hypothetical protein
VLWPLSATQDIKPLAQYRRAVMTASKTSAKFFNPIENPAYFGTTGLIHFRP